MTSFVTDTLDDRAIAPRYVIWITDSGLKILAAYNTIPRKFLIRLKLVGVSFIPVVRSVSQDFFGLAVRVLLSHVQAKNADKTVHKFSVSSIFSV